MRGEGKEASKGEDAKAQGGPAKTSGRLGRAGGRKQGERAWPSVRCGLQGDSTTTTVAEVKAVSCLSFNLQCSSSHESCSYFLTNIGGVWARSVGGTSTSSQPANVLKVFNLHSSMLKNDLMASSSSLPSEVRLIAHACRQSISGVGALIFLFFSGNNTTSTHARPHEEHNADIYHPSHEVVVSAIREKEREMFEQSALTFSTRHNTR